VRLSLLLNKLDNKVFSLQIVQLVRTAVVFGVSIFLAQFYKDTKIISQYETLLLVGTGLTFFWVSGLMTTFLPYYYNKSEEDRKSVIYNTFISLSALSILSFFAVIALGAMFFDTINVSLFIAYGLFILFNSPSFLIEYIYLVNQKNKSIILYAIIVFSIQLLVFCVPLFFGASLLVAVYCIAVLALFKFIFLVFLVRKYGKASFDFALVKAYLSKSTPIIITLLIGGSTEYVNGFIVKSYASDHEFALFRYGAREFPLSRILANTLSVVLSGTVANAIANGKLKDSLAQLKNSSKRLMHILFPLTLVLMLSSQYIYRFAFTETFEDSYKIFNIYLLLVVSRMVFPQTVLLGMQKNRQVMYASAIEFSVNFGLGLLLISRFGIFAVPFATLSAFYVYELILIFFVKKEGVKLKSYLPIKTWLIYSSLLWLVFLIL